MSSQLLAGKKGLILGVANSYSIAWAIAQQLHQEGATLGFSYLNQKLEKRVRPLAESLESPYIAGCDVTQDEDLERFFQEANQTMGKIDFLIHSVAFANKEDLSQPFYQTSREGFAQALDISAYSLVAMAKQVQPFMNDGGSIVALTYFGSQKVVPNYNVMGVAKAALEASVRYLAEDFGQQQIRVNSISAGPIKTLSAKGIKDFNNMLHHAQQKSPLRRNIESEEVAKTATFLVSDYSSGITGETLYVDAGYNIMGM